MKVDFLGTSAGWPLPRLGPHKDEVCKSTDPKDRRRRSALLVNDSILIDAGPDIYQELLNVGDPPVKAVFITHPHPDHMIGLWDISKILGRKINVHLIKQAQTILKRVLPATFNELDIVTILDQKEIKINTIAITPFSVIHSKTFPEVGYLVKENKKGFIYIPDVRRIDKKTEKFFHKAQVAILDGSILDRPFPSWTKAWGHWSIKEGIEALRKIKNIKKVYFTHIGHLVGPHKKVNEFLAKNYGKKFELAYDGLKINI